MNKYLIIFADAYFPLGLIEAKEPKEAAEKAIEEAAKIMKEVAVTLYLPGGLTVYDAYEYTFITKPNPLYKIEKMITIN